MEITVTNLTLDDIKHAIRNELKNFFAEVEEKKSDDEIAGIELAIEITGLAKATNIFPCFGKKTSSLEKRKEVIFFET